MAIDDLFKVGKSTHPLLAGARGMIGKKFILRQLNGVTIISRRPAEPPSRTRAQQRNRERFRKAAEFAKKEMMVSGRKAFYKQLAIRDGLPNAYTAAVRSFLQRRPIKVKRSYLLLRSAAPNHPAKECSCHRGRGAIGNPIKNHQLPSDTIPASLGLTFVKMRKFKTRPIKPPGKCRIPEY